MRRCIRSAIRIRLAVVSARDRSSLQADVRPVLPPRGPVTSTLTRARCSCRRTGRRRQPPRPEVSAADATSSWLSNTSGAQDVRTGSRPRGAAERRAAQQFSWPARPRPAPGEMRPSPRTPGRDRSGDPVAGGAKRTGHLRPSSSRTSARANVLSRLAVNPLRRSMSRRAEVLPVGPAMISRRRSHGGRPHNHAALDRCHTAAGQPARTSPPAAQGRPPMRLLRR